MNVKIVNNFMLICYQKKLQNICCKSINGFRPFNIKIPHLYCISILWTFVLHTFLHLYWCIYSFTTMNSMTHSSFIKCTML